MLPEGGQAAKGEPEGSGAASEKAYARRRRIGTRTGWRRITGTCFWVNEIGAPSATLYQACGAMFDEKSNWASRYVSVL